MNGGTVLKGNFINENSLLQTLHFLVKQAIASEYSHKKRTADFYETWCE